MHLLKQLFTDSATVSRELSEEERLLQENLRRFFESYRAKQAVLERLTAGEPIHAHLGRLQLALADELAQVESGERAEREIISDLKYLSKDAFIARMEELERILAQTREKDRYASQLLEELREVLVAQARKVKRLLDGESDPTVVESLMELLLIEKELVGKLSLVEDFRHLFAGLAAGERREEELQRAHKRLALQLYQQMCNVELTEEGIRSVDGHYISELTARIFNRLESVVMDAVRSGEIERHSYMDLEFVNSPLFEQFVLEEISIDRSMGKSIPSPRTIALFIGLFREMYNAQLMPHVEAAR